MACAVVQGGFGDWDNVSQKYECLIQEPWVLSDGHPYPFSSKNQGSLCPQYVMLQFLPHCWHITMGYACSLSGLHAGSKTQMLSILRSSYLKVVPLCIPTKHSHIYDLAMGRGQSGKMYNFYITSNPLVSSSTLLSLLSLDAFICWCGNEGEDGGKAEKNGCCLFPASFIFFSVLYQDYSFWSQEVWCPCSLFLQETIEGTNKWCVWGPVYRNMSINTTCVC